MVEGGRRCVCVVKRVVHADDSSRVGLTGEGGTCTSVSWNVSSCEKRLPLIFILGAPPPMDMLSLMTNSMYCSSIIPIMPVMDVR